MSKTAVQAKERRKALASRKTYVQQPLTDLEIIADCKARIRMCEADMTKQGRNNIIERKIQGFRDTIVIAEKQISDDNIQKEVKTNDN